MRDHPRPCPDRVPTMSLILPEATVSRVPVPSGGHGLGDRVPGHGATVSLILVGALHGT